MARSIPILPDHIYHIYNRGNNREPIFLEPENYSFFLRRLQKYFSKGSVDPDKAEVDLLAYCLMPNHFHLLITFDRPVDFPNLMRSFSTSYVKSFNKFYGRTGHLFEGDYQVKVIEKESYLCSVIRYIHLNPFFAGLVSKAEDWLYSDYREWVNASSTHTAPSTRLRDELFGSAAAYNEFVTDYAAAKAAQKEMEKLLGLI